MKSPFGNLFIRTAVVVRPGYGFIYAGDPKKEKKEIPHVVIFSWEDGVVTRGDANYDAHSACLVSAPSHAIVNVSEPGYFNVNARTARPVTGDLFTKSAPRPGKSESRRSRGIRGVYEVAGKAYAVGIRGMVYRLDDFSCWTRIDMGLPTTFDVQAIHGTSDENIFAVGTRGQLWHFNGKSWTRKKLPTRQNLTAVRCADDGTVFVGGHDGVLLRGKKNVWRRIKAPEHDIWDLELFQKKLYVSALDGLFVLSNDELRPVEFGKDAPKTTYQLSAADGVMWSNGERDVMSFDGKSWRRIV